MKDSIGKRDVQAVLKQKAALHTKHFVFKSCSNRLNTARIAFAFSRKSGSAVSRNKFKRRLRELTRMHVKKGLGVDLMCFAKSPLKNISDTSWSVEKQKIMGWCESF